MTLIHPDKLPDTFLIEKHLKPSNCSALSLFSTLLMSTASSAAAESALVTPQLCLFSLQTVHEHVVKTQHAGNCFLSEVKASVFLV